MTTAKLIEDRLRSQAAMSVAHDSQRTVMYEAADTIAALRAERAGLGEALRGMLAHSCVADADPNDKDEADHAAERLARKVLATLTPESAQ